MAQIKAWSYTRLLDYETCAYRAKLKYVDRVPEPERVIPKGKTEHPLDRGSRLHEAAELYVKGGVELVSELKDFGPRLDELKTLYQSKQVIVEEEWAFDRQWASVAWRSETAWGRLKLDAMALDSPKSARVIDYKTGKRYGNEVKHTEQGQLYQLQAFMRYPALQEIQVEFWYFDQGPDEDLAMHYTRAEGTRYFDKFHHRAVAMTDATEFPANPNAYSCKWCPYNGNACEYGISKAALKVMRGQEKAKKPSGMAALFMKFD